MLDKVFQPAVAYGIKDFLEALRSRRLLIVATVVGAVLIGASGVLGLVMVHTPSPDGGQEGVPSPYEVWFRGSDGVLVGIAFGLVPFLLPFLPILATSRILEKDKNRGIFQLSLSKPVPPWGPALGKFGGLYGALAIPTAAISLGCVAAVQAATGAGVDGGLAVRFLASSLLLVGLYLLLSLLLGSLLPSGLVAPILTLVWLGFNLVRQTAFFITARLATVLGADQATVFQLAWTDFASFTGVYQGLLAPSVPAGLDFVVTPTPGGGLALAAQLLPWALLAWFVVLFLLYAWALLRVPSH